MEFLDLFMCTAGLVFGAVLVYGLKRDWPWILDPPEWMFAIYLPQS
jgi:hypothetical protein